MSMQQPVLALTLVNPAEAFDPPKIKGWLASVRKVWAREGCTITRIETGVSRRGDLKAAYISVHGFRV